MITLEDYYLGRDSQYRHELTQALQANARETVRRVSLLLEMAAADGVTLEPSPRTGSLITSGWRPAAVNAATPNAAPRSRHMTCEAVDLYDPDGDLDEWCLAHPERLAELDLYLEHPAATKGWCHLQIVPPRSQARLPVGDRRRWFYP